MENQLNKIGEKQAVLFEYSQESNISSYKHCSITGDVCRFLHFNQNYQGKIKNLEKEQTHKIQTAAMQPDLMQ